MQPPPQFHPQDAEHLEDPQEHDGQPLAVRILTSRAAILALGLVLGGAGTALATRPADPVRAVEAPLPAKPPEPPRIVYEAPPPPPPRPEPRIIEKTVERIIERCPAPKEETPKPSPAKAATPKPKPRPAPARPLYDPFGPVQRENVYVQAPRRPPCPLCLFGD